MSVQMLKNVSKQWLECSGVTNGKGRQRYADNETI